jgi:hypothetical protein
LYGDEWMQFSFKKKKQRVTFKRKRERELIN